MIELSTFVVIVVGCIFIAIAEYHGYRRGIRQGHIEGRRAAADRSRRLWQDRRTFVVGDRKK